MNIYKQRLCGRIDAILSDGAAKFDTRLPGKLGQLTLTDATGRAYPLIRYKHTRFKRDALGRLLFKTAIRPAASGQPRQVRRTQFVWDLAGQ
ncbi:MAG: hypothetical protein FWG14_10750, partial [Peptococcaceae bacterium]|nr:hypothetical protein [Peptococcaceae bacterium]